MTTVTITETSNAVTVDDENVQVVDVRVVNTATTTSAGLMSSSDKSKLDGIETGADVTDATNVEAAGAVMETDTSTTNMQFVVDEDNMASDSATKIPTQQSVKAYVDSQISSKDELSELAGDLDDISDGTNHVKMTNAERTKLTGIETGATADQTASEIRTLVDSATDSNVFTDADHTKLDGIEANATADQTDAEIKTAYENNSDTNAFTDSEKTKLSGIETNATADQSASEILTAIKTVDGSTSGLDADLLDGQEGSYYQQASTALNTSTSFGGDVSGTYDAIVVADDSHNHVISNVDGLQTALDAKAPLASPALTGTPTAPTAAVDDSTTKIATTAFVQQELAQLVDSAPSTLDTLNEIAAAINDDANFNTTVTNSLANRLRVDTDAQGLTSTQQNNAKTNLGLDDVATSGAYSDLTGTPTNATTSTDGLMSSSDKTKLDGVEAGATADQSASEIKTAYESNADTNAFTDAQQTKLTGIEANATADQTDSEIKTAYENNADTNAFTDAEKTKLSNIETNATADQSASEILTLIKTVDGTTSGLDADVLDGQEGSHYLDYNNFTNTPTIPSNTSDLTNDSGFITSADGGNAQTLDSLDSTQFLRSDAADTKTSGNLTFSDNVQLKFGDSGDLSIFSDGNNTRIYGTTGSTSIGQNAFGNIRLTGDDDQENMLVATVNGSVELYYDNSKKLETVSNGVALTGNLLLSDNEKAIFGSGSDLQIYHDGSDSYIRDAGTGAIVFISNIYSFRNAANTEQIARFDENGSVDLYHDNSKKLETTSTGATVTGTLIADKVQSDDFRINGTSNDFPSETGNAHIIATNNGGSFPFNESGSLLYRPRQNDTDGRGNHYFYTGATPTLRQNIKANGDIAFYASDGTSQNLFWDASTSRLGINNTSPSTALDVNGDLTLTSTDAGATENPTLDLYRNSSSPADQDIIGHINFSGENDAGEKITYGEIQSRIRDVTDGTENGAIETYVETNGNLDLYTVHQDGQSQFYKDVAIISNDAGSTENPTLDLYRNSASPADSDVLGHITFSGENSAGEKIVYGEIETAITDQTDGTEDGDVIIRSMQNGTLTKYYSAGFGSNIMFKPISFTAGSSTIFFEGTTNNSFETSLTVTDPTSDNTITLPDATGTVALQEQAYQAINAQTGTTYTTVLADAGKLVTLSNASAITLTIPPNSSVAYPLGTKLDFAQLGVGQVTVAAGSGVTINSSLTLKLRTQYSPASCIKVATDTWLLIGDLE